MDPDYFKFIELQHELVARTVSSQEEVNLDVGVEIHSANIKIILGDYRYTCSTEVSDEEKMYLSEVLDGYLNSSLNVNPLESGFLAETFIGMLLPWIKNQVTVCNLRHELGISIGGQKWLA